MEQKTENLNLNNIDIHHKESNFQYVRNVLQTIKNIKPKIIKINNDRSKVNLINVINMKIVDINIPLLCCVEVIPNSNKSTRNRFDSVQLYSNLQSGRHALGKYTSLGCQCQAT